MVKQWLERYFQIDISYFITDSFWWLLGRSFFFLISITTTLFLANWLEKTDYGTYQYILASFSILAALALPGVNLALVRSIAKGLERTFSLAVKTKFKWALFGGLLALLISLWYLFNQNFLLAFAFFLVAIFLPFLTTFDLYLSYFEGKKRFDLQSKLLVLAYLVPAIILIPVIILSRNLTLILITYFLSHTFVRGIIFFWTKKKIKDSMVDLETINFGKHLSLMEGLSILANQLDKIILWQFLGPISLAIYSIAKMPYQRIRSLIPIMPLALPRLSTKDISQIKKRIFLSFLKLFPFFFLLSFFLILVAPFFYQLLFPKYMEAVKYFRILSLALILVPFALLRSVFVAEAKKKELYFFSLGLHISKIILFLFLIPVYGILGAVLAEVISISLINLFLLYFYWKL